MNSNQTSMDWRLFINDHPIFGELTTEHVNTLLDPANSTLQSFKRNEVIFRAGEISNSFFIIGEGSVRVELSSEDSNATNISTLYKGDYFGEMSAIDEKSGRAATILACEDCSLLEIKSRPFQQILKSNPELEFKLLSMLAERLRHVNEHLLKTTRLSYENKFSILSEKIDSQSKVVEASLNASQAVFEQTKIRTSEIINAAERGRSRITWVMSTLTAGFTLLLALFSFLGYDKLNTAEEKLKEIELASIAIEKSKQEIQKSEQFIASARDNIKILAASIDNLNKDVSESEIAKRILFETLIPIFSIQVEEKSKDDSKPDPKDLGFHILEINDIFITTKLFKKLFFMIDTSHNYNLDNIAELAELKNSDLDQNKKAEIEQDIKLNLAMITYCTNFIYQYIQAAEKIGGDNPLALFLSNYILLLVYAMDEQYESSEDNFNKRLNELNRNYSGDEGNRIKKLINDEDFIAETRNITLEENGDLEFRRNFINKVWSYKN